MANYFGIYEEMHETRWDLFKKLGSNGSLMGNTVRQKKLMNIGKPCNHFSQQFMAYGFEDGREVGWRDQESNGKGGDGKEKEKRCPRGFQHPWEGGDQTRSWGCAVLLEELSLNFWFLITLEPLEKQKGLLDFDCDPSNFRERGRSHFLSVSRSQERLEGCHLPGQRCYGASEAHFQAAPFWSWALFLSCTASSGRVWWTPEMIWELCSCNAARCSGKTGMFDWHLCGQKPWTC